jgi:hypothetical protein
MTILILAKLPWGSINHFALDTLLVGYLVSWIIGYLVSWIIGYLVSWIPC